MATKYSGNKEEVLSLNTYIKIIRCAETISSQNSAYLNKKGLTESQFAILDAIFHLGPLKQKILGEKILKSGGNITHVVDNLEKQKLVTRKNNEKDRRQFEIHLTKKGQKVFEKILPDQVKLIKNQLSVLSKEEQETLGALCRKVGLENNN